MIDLCVRDSCPPRESAPGLSQADPTAQQRPPGSRIGCDPPVRVQPANEVRPTGQDAQWLDAPGGSLAGS